MENSSTVKKGWKLLPLLKRDGNFFHCWKGMETSSSVHDFMWRYDWLKGANADDPYLEMRTGHTAGNLAKENLLHLHKLHRLNHIQNLLNLPEEHDLLLRRRLGPVLEHTLNDGLRQRGILLNELHNAVRQLSGGGDKKRWSNTCTHWEGDGWWRNWQMPCRHKPYAKWIRMIAARHSLERDTCPGSALYATESTLSPGTACVPPSTARQIR